MIRRRSLLATAVLVAAGCTATPERNTAGPVELTWATAATEAATDIVQMWNQQHRRGPRVRVAALPPGADDQHDVMAVELDAGLGRLDILEVDLVWTGEFAEAGWLVDLEDLRDEIERVTLPGQVMQSAVWNGRLWAAPFTTDAGLLYYRTDLVDRPPATWPELRDLGLRIGAEQGIAPFAADGRQHEGLVVQYLEYFWAAGGEVFDSHCKVLFEEQPARTAVEFMRNAFSEHFYAPSFDTMGLKEALTVFQSGQAVFLRSWPYVYRPMNQDAQSPVAGKVGIAPLPTFGGQRPAAALGGHNLGVNRFSPHVDAAKDFVHFVSTSREVQRYLAQRHSLAPTMAAVYDELAADPLMAELHRVLPQARPRPSTPEWASISEEMQQQIFAAYTGKKSPDAAVRAIREFLDATDPRC